MASVNHCLFHALHLQATPPASSFSSYPSARCCKHLSLCLLVSTCPSLFFSYFPIIPIGCFQCGKSPEVQSLVNFCHLRGPACPVQICHPVDCLNVNLHPQGTKMRLEGNACGARILKGLSW